MNQLDQAAAGRTSIPRRAAHELRTPLIGALRTGRSAVRQPRCRTRMRLAKRRPAQHATVGAIAGSRAGPAACMPLRERYCTGEIVVHVASEFDVAAQKSRRTISSPHRPLRISATDEIVLSCFGTRWTRAHLYRLHLVAAGRSGSPAAPARRGSAKGLPGGVRRWARVHGRGNVAAIFDLLSLALVAQPAAAVLDCHWLARIARTARCRS